MPSRKLACVLSLPLIFAAAAANNASANTISAEINNETVKLEYKGFNRSNGSVMSAGILYHEDNGEVYSLGLSVESQIQGQRNLYGGLGGKLYYIEADGPSGAALGLGGHVRYDIPNVKGLSLFTEAYYSPQVLSFNDIEHFSDFTVAVKYKMLEQGSVFVGYRKVHVDFDFDDHADIDEGAFFGIQLSL